MVVVVPSWRKPPWRGEHLGILGEQVVEEVARVRQGVDAGPRATHAAPHDAATVMPDGHCELVEVPRDRAEGAESLNAQDDIEAIQRERVAANVEGDAVDFQLCRPTDALAWHAFAIGDLDRQPGAPNDVEPQAAGHLVLHERV